MKKTAEASKIGSGKIQLKLVKFFKTLSIAQFLSKMLQIFSTFLSLLIVNTARIKDNSKNFYTNENFLSYILLHFGKFLSYADLSFISTKFLFLSNKIQLYFCHCNKLPQLSRWFGGVFIHFCEFKILEKIIASLERFIYFC